MKEVIIKLTSDRIKVKGGEYVQDLVRCKECKSYNTEAYQDGYGYCDGHCSVVQDDDFCSYGEREDER